MTIPELLMLAVGFIIGLTGPSLVMAFIRFIDPEGFERANRIARREMVEDLRREEANDR